jgi:DNA-binding winged helix-turn-helix (wHTH) protein/predicted Ser/Thr protein kinase
VANPAGRKVRFGPFELDPRSGELRKHGIRIKLREQPVRILAMLLEHPGEVVLREEIRQKLWPNNTIVEFDHGINAAIQKLRDALGDSVSEPRYVETVARRGYRFVGELEKDSQLEGTTLSHYRILEKLGEGGMGVVWRAHDPRLNRDVAIKISAEKFSDRFEREARAIAALNHPNICTLYDVGPNFLVMELIEGESPKGPLPVEEALRIARQIADALDAAHEKGIVHRDLKPANIKIKPDGMVKVLDFGLAKTLEAPSGDPEDSPTVTVAGMILGTAAYMSPEQARGKEVDKRSDIWAFGVVLYELLTGRRPFHGNDLQEMLASVVKDQPDLSAIPIQVRPLLEKCLEKDPKKRLRDIGDAWQVGQGHALPPKAVHTKFGWVAAALLAAVAAISRWAPGRATQPLDRPLIRLDVDLGADVSLPPPAHGGSNVAISPDGMRLAYASGMPPTLFTRRLDQPKATQLPGTEGASCVFFSFDGRWVGFVARDKLSKISVDGGAVVTLGDIRAAEFRGASWGEDGSIVASEAFGKGLLRIPSGGGSSETVAALSGETALAFPQILPGGKAILFAAATAADVDRHTIEVLTLADHRRKILVRAGQSPRYLPTSSTVGHLVYVNKATLFVIPFDLKKLETRGEAVPILDDVAYNPVSGNGQFDVSLAPSGSGTLVYRRSQGGVSGETGRLQWVGPSGEKEPLGPKRGSHELRLSFSYYCYPELSPDGKEVAVDDRQDVWVYDQQSDAMSRLTSGGANVCPIWSPDGQYIVFSSEGKGMFQARADGAGQPQRLTQGTTHVPYSFTADGKRLAYGDWGAGNSQIWTVPLEDQGGRLKAGKPEQFLKDSFADDHPSFSPDGRWLAYESNESEKIEVYIRPFPAPSAGQGGKWQVSTSGGVHPHWSRNGRDLLYQSGDKIMAASYTVKGETFVAGKPRVWIAKLGGTMWDLAADGKSVLVATPVESAEELKPEHQVVFLENFFDELRRRAPAGGK